MASVTTGRPATVMDRIVGFCRELRAAGVRVNTTTALTAVQAVAAVDVTNRAEFYYALQTALTASPHEQSIFAGVFAQYWGLATGEGCGDESSSSGPSVARPDAGAEPGESAPSPGAALPGDTQLGGLEGPQGEQDGDSGPPTPGTADDNGSRPPEPGRGGEGETADISAGGRRGGASLTEVKAVRTLPPGDPAELARLRRVISRLLGPLQYLPAGKARRRRGSGILDLRGSLRRSMRHGGELLDLRFRGKAPRRIDLVAMLDVSGSMDTHTEFLLQFMYALQASARNVETFVFSTKLSRISPYMRRGFNVARAEVARRVRHWSGGTRLGDCLKEFNDRYGQSTSGASTCAIIISDGWDRGEPEVLDEALQRLKRQVRMIIWLNPLLGVPGYQPLARGLQIASRYVDAFLPARDANSLSRAASLLVRR